MFRMKSIIDVLLERLDAMTGSEVSALARNSGVPYNTIRNIRNRVNPNPGVRTVEKLMATLPRRKK